MSSRSGNAVCSYGKAIFLARGTSSTMRETKKGKARLRRRDLKQREQDVSMDRIFFQRSEKSLYF